MDPDETRRLVLEFAVERNGGKSISCARAFEIHRRYGIALKDIGRTCNENGVKIRACQLGCFK